MTSVDYIHVFLPTNHCLFADTAKGAKSLSTLTCVVLRRALPKVPLPIPSTFNPFYYHLPTSSSGSSVELGNPVTLQPPSNPLHTSHSAPELVSLTTHQDSYGHELKKTAAFPEHDATQPISEQSQPEDQATEEQSHSTTTDDPINCLLHSDSDSKTTPSAETESDPAMSPKELALYNKFFPELKQVEVISKTLSSPQLQTLERNSLPESLNADEQRVQDRISSSSCVAVPLVIIPTAQPLSQSSDEGKDMAELIGGSSSFSFSSDERDGVCSEVKVKSVVPFVEIPTPQVLGHFPKTNPELLYKKVPSVTR